jgi:homoserine/homoserine lactone efflux protein
MSLETWLAFCAMDVVLCCIPGPAVLFVVSSALAGGVRAGLAAALGICTTNAAYFALSGTGVAAVILASGRLFAALKWAGAAYLVMVGIGMMLVEPHRGTQPSAAAAQRSFLRAIVVQGANPKALIFFVALVPQFVHPQASIAWQLLVLGLTGIVIEITVLTSYVAVAVRARRVAGARLAGPLERIGGGFLVAAGARLALVRSP